ncbi:MAG: cellulase family glycosylhydrolase [Deltaproteobacteria bacterium]|nr:cellulase family glycosylhydrolase [Deltaproteobacteria bacterium]
MSFPKFLRALRIIRLLMLAGLLALAPACGGDDDDDSSDETSTESDDDTSATDDDDDTSDDDDTGDDDVCPDGEFEPLSELRTDGRYFKDAYDRVVLLRGINTGGRAKVPPFVPWDERDGFDDDLTAYYDFLEDWGVNVIRLCVFWEAIEPTRGTYDESYLAKIEAQVDEAASRGIYVFIDFHQDIYSRILGGSGAPAWALPNPEMEPIPADQFLWVFRYNTDPLVLDAFDHFWTNEDGVRDAYVAMAKVYAERFADRTHVFAFDLMNEPSAGGETGEDLGAWYEDYLQPLYEEMTDAIRGEASRYVMFAGPTWQEALDPEEADLTKPDIENMAFAPHYYDPIVTAFGTYNGKPERTTKGLTAWEAVGDEFGTPVIVTEFGTLSLLDDGTAGAYLTDEYDVFDDLFLSGTYWTHEVAVERWNKENAGLLNPDWTERTDYTDAFARPYPKATSGVPIDFHYDAGTHEIAYTYTTADTHGAPTVIALPPRRYPFAPSVSASFGEGVYHPETNEVWIYDRVCERGADYGGTQTLTITP